MPENHFGVERIKLCSAQEHQKQKTMLGRVAVA
jgi:hypothetical protein